MYIVNRMIDNYHERKKCTALIYMCKLVDYIISSWSDLVSDDEDV